MDLVKEDGDDQLVPRGEHDAAEVTTAEAEEATSRGFPTLNMSSPEDVVAEARSTDVLRNICNDLIHSSLLTTDPKEEIYLSIYIYPLSMNIDRHYFSTYSIAYQITEFFMLKKKEKKKRKKEATATATDGGYFLTN